MDDMFGDAPIPLEAQIHEVEREIRMRLQVYPKLVSRKQLSPHQMDQQISAMEAVRDTLLNMKKLSHASAPKARHTDPHTSHDAAAQAEKPAKHYKKLIAALLANHPEGLTEAECAIKLGVPRTSLSPNFAPMEKDKAIHRRSKADGNFLTRTNDGSGKQAAIWFSGAGE